MRRHWLPAVLGGLLGVLHPGAADRLRAQGPPPAEDFGRWDRTPRQCRMEGPGGRPGGEPCSLLRLEQPAAGLLTVHFLGGPAAGSRVVSRQLVFAGVLESGSRPMRCGEGACAPRWPLGIAVSAVGAGGLSSGGIDLGVPQAFLARGHCQLSGARIRCSAEGAGGSRWTALAVP